ncbi:NUDIX domain-containing protein [Kribbella jejuensis]|uniref:ADP-ribose pyrophosphatase YjhB (NUDIX family) n=1 Tax=Kribbella jejuensis TaxID=236068 RepID=A0A542EW05_9ACTN|nr:NUDIX hydrolase [Kribbella jejuensis]TQJ19540.1 ADP-ribose pyrophosphatase YjhB (NUDIX family) [Kribbella jejuensis]
MSELDAVAQYVAGLPRKRVVAGVLFRSADGRVLLVEPSYKANWEIPGGSVEADESPWDGAVRELREELNWTGPLGRLLVIDHVPTQTTRPEALVFIFDGGVLTDGEAAALKFPDGELVSAAFYTLAEARTRLKPLLADRITVATQAAADGTTALCTYGKRVA